MERCSFLPWGVSCPAFGLFSFAGKRRWRVLWLLLAAGGLLAPAAAAQSTWTVNTLSDSSDAPGSCGGGGTCSLRDALAQASSGDTISFAGTLSGTITLSSTLTVTRDVTISGPGANLVAISGNHAVPVLTVAAGTVILSGVAIEDGASAANGGGILNQSALAVSRCAFLNNSAAQNGGALSNEGVLTVAASTFLGNSAVSGGAVFNDATGLASVSDSTFSGGTAQERGAAVYSLGNVAITRSTFAGNTSAGTGGAVEGSGSAGKVSITNSTLAGNSAVEGGAVSSAATLIIADSTFSGNSASSGGAILRSAGSLAVSNSILTGDSGQECEDGNSGLCPTDGSNGNVVGGSGVRLLPLGWYGGVTYTMLPLPGSSAICAGLEADLPSGVNADQRGFPVNSSCVDAGAVQTNYLTVANTSDSGPGSLREALSEANAAGYLDIAVAATGTINLASALPALTGQTNIIGPGSANLTISAAWTHGFVVNSGALATFYGISIANGGFGLGGALQNNGTATVINCAFSGNHASAGGAVTNNDGLLTITGSTFSGNTSLGGGAGGAIFMNGGSGTVTGSTFTNNAATRGGAIFNYSGFGDSATLIVSNSTFAGNSAPDGGGGAILNGGTLTLVNSTLAGNSANVGGGLWEGGTLRVFNSIIAGNTSLYPPNDDCDGCGTVAGSNLISTPSNVIDPKLGPLQLNAGSATLETMMPLPGSPAICAGSPSAAAGIALDERGFPRVNTSYAGYSGENPCIDLGAVQTNYSAVEFVQQPTDTAVNTPIAPAPTVAILEANPNAAAPNNTDAVNGVPITLAYSGGANEIGGSMSATTAGGAAAFSGLTPNVSGGGFTLSASVPVTAGVTLSATSDPFGVRGASSITSASGTEGEVGVPVSFTITTGGYPAATLTHAGTLPAGFTFMDNGNGTATLSGTPLAAGSYLFRVQASNGIGPAATQTFTLKVAGAVTLSPAMLAAGRYGSSYSATVEASGGLAPYTFSESGTLPAGLSWKSGTLSGTPGQAGSFSISITVQDSLGGTATQSYTLAVTGATLTAAANNATRPYGAANPVFSGSITGAQSGESFAESFTTAATIRSAPGAYAIVPGVTGANLSSYTLALENGTLTVTKAASTTTLSASNSSATPGQSVTLTARVVSSTSGTPTGSVSFYDGSTLLGTAALNAGSASYSTSALGAGSSHGLSAVYSGDGNFTSSSAAGVPVAIAALDFTVGVRGSARAAAAPGATAAYQLSVSPLYGSYGGPVSFTASGLPTGASISFSPARIPASGGAQTVKVSIALAQTHTQAANHQDNGKLAPVAFAVLLLPLAGMGRVRRNGRHLGRILLVCLLVLGAAATTVAVSGCGVRVVGFGQPQTYSVAVTATSGALRHGTTLTLEVE